MKSYRDTSRIRQAKRTLIPALFFAVTSFQFLCPIDVSAQTTAGTMTGWVVADAGTEFGDIEPGQNSTISISSLNVDNTQTSPASSVFAEASFPDVRLLVDSRNAPTQVSYGAAYFGDTLTFTGGVGEFEIDLEWIFDGGISGAGGSFGVGGPGPDAPFEGSAAVDFKVFVGAFGDQVLDLSDTDLAKDLALAPNAGSEFEGFEVPFFDPTDGTGEDSQSGNFLFDEYDEEGNLTGDLIAGYYTDTNADQVVGFGGGARFNWNYGESFDIGVLLEGWAEGGGIVDFANTGSFVNITVPQGTIVTSSGGGNYNVTFAVPEPASSSILAFGFLTLGMIRRRTPAS